MQINIRKAQRQDVPILAQMALEFEEYLMSLEPGLVEETPALETFQRVLEEGFDDPKHCILVAESFGDNKVGGGRIMGLGDFWAYPEFLHAGLSGYLCNLYVRERWRGKGVGKSLLDALLKEAKARGVVAMHISVKKLNVKAQEFYKKNGITEELVMLETRLDR
ncbi:MAG: N-acetyltransferase [Candidatus Thermoplasmatota archaeon]|nr:N-acetyltransferase [Candidatus Thermoplasmatota archaeon]